MICPQGYQKQRETDSGISLIKAESLCHGWGPLHFPFKIQGFHADNGSEYINDTVAELLEKLRIEFTKSRPRTSNDNALVESKNGSVVRKLYGYMHIPQQYADEFKVINEQPVYRYVNFHRPCYFPSIITDQKGKERKVYRYQDIMTP